MAIIVEDGTIVSNANSYASVADVKDYLTMRGLPIPADEKIEQALILAMDKLATYNAMFPGRTHMMAALAWPRTNAWYGSYEYPENTIPIQLQKAQIIFAQYVLGGGKLFANKAPTDVVLKSKKIDVLEWEYAVPEGDNMLYNIQPVVAEAEALMLTLLKSGSMGINSPAVRG